MGPESLQPGGTVQWGGSVTLRNRSDVPPREPESLSHDINEDVRYNAEDRADAPRDTGPPRSTAQQPAARKPHFKRAVKDRKHVYAAHASKTTPRKERHDESLPVVKHCQSPSWLLELDGEELNPLLPSPFPNDLVRRHMHSRQSGPGGDLNHSC
jgi:hypothetical protein